MYETLLNHCSELSYEQQARMFFNALMHDDKNSYYIVQTRIDGTWKTQAALKVSQLKQLEVGLCDGIDMYITHNGFSSKRCLTERLRQINGLLFDLDIHGQTGNTLVATKAKLIDRIFNEISSQNLPRPTMLVDTGRGLQLHYVFERSCSYRVRGGAINSGLLGFVNNIRDALNKKLEVLCSGVVGVKNDNNVGNYNRVCRVPGTLNSKTGTKARIILLPEEQYFYSLSALDSRMDIPKLNKDKTSYQEINFNSLCISRLKAAEALRDYREYNPQGRGCEGHSRNELMWFYFNAAVPVYGLDKAYELTKAFNSRYINPLPVSEIDATRKTLKRVGQYRITREGVVRHLDLTSEEIKATNFFRSKKATDREIAKAKTREKKLKRNTKIFELRSFGYTYQQIADQLGICRRTVCSVIAKGPKSTTASRKSSKAAPRRFTRSLVDISKSIQVLISNSKRMPREQKAERVQKIVPQYIVYRRHLVGKAVDTDVRSHVRPLILIPGLVWLRL